MDNLNFLYKQNLNGKVRKSMNENMCQKVHFGDKSTFGSSQNGKTCPKKVNNNKKKYLFVH